ncbi:MAG: hypothetical protein WCL29_01585 [Pseudomonadota bacterium]
MMTLRKAIYDLKIIQRAGLAALLCITFLSDAHAQDKKAATKKPPAFSIRSVILTPAKLRGKKAISVASTNAATPTVAKFFRFTSAHLLEVARCH